MNCSPCGRALPSGARFCPSCGGPCADASTAEATESRKVVTVLFCDLVGSTALSGGLDPETLRSVTLRYFDLMRRQIEFHGGTVEKFIGDAVMAVFGVPVVHEDDARRALAAALGMLTALDGLNTELDTALGVRLEVRIGVNTGQVVSGSDASARQALVSGETVNVAARLEQNAGPGRILIGADTLRAAGAAVRAESVGPLTLKGKAEPVTAYRLLELREDNPELERRFDVRFVGRGPELASLDASLAAVSDGRGARRILVHGEAGIGKTRLLREWLRSRAPLSGAGRCRPYGDQGSLGPLADAVTSVLAAAPAPHGVTEALGVLSAGLLLDGTPNPTVAETCAALVGVLGALSVPGPVVLVLDDFHWAAPLLSDVVDRLVQELDRAAVLVVLLARPELIDMQSDLSESPTLALAGLSYDESALLAAGLTEVTAHWDATPRRLLERADGNPLHLEQLLAAALDTGSQDELPPTVQALLGARIDALEPRERGVLDQASVIGREFTADQLTGICGTRAEVRSALLRLSGRRLVEPGPRASFRFTSGLVQEVTYASMSKRARAEGHEKAAAVPSVRSTGPAAVGGHLERAYGYRRELGRLDDTAESLRSDAAEALGLAGAQALARSDLPWADDLLTRSAALHRPGEPGGAAAVRRLGEARAALGRTEEAQALLMDVLATPADPLEAAHARLALASVAPEEEAPAEAAAAVLAVFERAGDELGQARACLRLAQRDQSQGRHGDADVWLTRGLAHTVRADGEPERAAALGAIGISLWRGPLPVPAASTRCRALLDEHGGGRRAVRITLNCPLAVLSALQDRWTDARACLAEAARQAAELGYAETRVVLPLFGATVEVLAGETARARALLDTATEVAAQLGISALRDSVALESARLHLDCGEASAAARVLARIDGEDAYPHAEAVELNGLLGRVAAAEGRHEESLRLTARAVRAAGQTDSPVVRGGALLDRAHALALLGLSEHAGRAAAKARAVFAAKGHLPGVRWARALLPENGNE
ncbi:adenylate/guanylate cyclase domain-containing protein [Streptomyces sp. NPDC051172]|uniref:adenylate/guanylate cyclase domain-containing protein n=1 Tax=Streptomyces sp. NPDC051172 TaxID=3155796 RepID=UPI00341582B0